MSGFKVGFLMNRVLNSIIGFIFTTFALATLYGIFCGTMNVIDGVNDPVAAGRHAASGVYSLFGDVSEEMQRNDIGNNTESVAHRIARPYAATADIMALLTGKLEVGAADLIHGTAKRVDKAATI